MSEQMAEGLEDLSPRLREVLLLVAEGKTNQEIGDELSIKMETARNHVHLLARRIGVSGTPENRNVRVKLIRWLFDKKIRELTGEVRMLRRGIQNAGRGSPASLVGVKEFLRKFELEEEIATAAGMPPRNDNDRLEVVK